MVSILKVLRILVLGVLFALPGAAIGVFFGGVTKVLAVTVVSGFLGLIAGFAYGVSEARKVR